jgi:hypothetical protein
LTVISHPDPLRDHFQQLALTVVEGELQLIEVRVFGAPQMGLARSSVKRQSSLPSMARLSSEPLAISLP